MSRTVERFMGKTVVVTGGGSGIGLRTAGDLHSEGATVHILGRDGEKLARARQSIGEERLFIHRCDISDEAQVEKTFGAVEDISGGLSCLVNNAAINQSRNDILHSDIQDWKKTLDAI